MADPIRILFAESIDANTTLAMLALERGGLDCAIRQVQTGEDFIGELAAFQPDVILSNFHLPGFDGMTALAAAREHCRAVPLIFVAVADSEEYAVQSLLDDAADYVLAGNLARLPAAVKRALRDATDRAAAGNVDARTREAELRFQGAFNQAAVGLANIGADGRVIQVNLKLAAMLGYEPAQMTGMILGALSHEADMDSTGAFHLDLQAGRIDTFTLDKRYLHKDGRTVWMRKTVSPMLAADGRSIDDLVVFEDITDSRRDREILDLEHTVARCLADSDFSGGTLKTIICAICKSEGWDLGCYFCLDEAAGLMRFDEFWRKESPESGQFIAGSRGPSFGRGEGLVGAVWESGEPLWIADASADPRVTLGAELRAANLHAGVVFPACAGGKTVGVLTFWCRATQEPDTRLLQAVRMIGGQIGQFMERQAQQRQIARLNRIQRVLSGINSLIVRVRGRDELFREACRIAVDDGRFSLAWVGIVDRAANQLVVAACHETMQGYLELVPLGLDPAVPAGIGLAGRAVLERKAMVVNNIDSSSLPLKQDALDYGFRSVVALPLVEAVGVAGVLCLYADSVNFFDQEEVKLLQELAGDISFAMDHLAKADRINYLAYYDALTGLANRTLFTERVTQRIAAAKSRGQRLAVLVVDVDRFKLINESLGRAAGDLLLQQIAGRFPQGTADQARYARIGADQFAVVIPEVESEEALGRRIQERMDEPAGPRFKIGDSELRIAVRLGIALYPNDGDNPETLLANAESALKRAKAGGEKMLFYRPQMSDRVIGRLNLENQLRLALEREEFVLHYQPKMHLSSGRIEAVEALIRWNSPELGLVPPMQFIPLMEQTGMILEVGTWALHQAAQDYRAMLERGARPLRIAVNVSPIQLRRHNFVEMVKRAVQDGAGPPGIDLEITESLMMEDIEGNIDKLSAVRSLGLNIAIDDFGTGYSSLGYLARLPADALKIDRSFVISMLEEANTMTLVSTIMSLAHTLNLKVIAEGVETKEQEKILALLRCDQIQGHLISPALPLEEMLAFTRLWSERAESPAGKAASQAAAVV